MIRIDIKYIFLYSIMNSQEVNIQKIINKIKRRLIDYIQYHFESFHHVFVKTYKVYQVAFNEALFEEWQLLLKNMVFLKQDKENTAKPTNLVSKEQKRPIPTISSITLTKTLTFPSSINTKFLMNLQNDSINLYEIFPKGKQSQLRKFQLNKLSFNKGLVKKYSSYNFIDEYNAIVIGGSIQGSPNRKSKDIMRFNVQNYEVHKIAELSYGISSHSTCKIDQFIYIVGGNKDFNTVTKFCLKYNIINKSVTSIGQLNYPSASHTIIPWKNKYIYKIGGIGSCFGSFDLSPYIQRYSLEEDQWQIINPIIKLNDMLLDYYSLLINSLAFFNSQNSILIIGGFDIDYKSSNKMFEMVIKEQQSEKGQFSHIHQIQRLGILQGLQSGGFLQQQYLNYPYNEIIAIQTINKIKNVTHKIVKISQIISYL